MVDPLLQVSGLGHSHDRPVLADVSFTLRRGRICVILGPSGCGKTTLLRCIAGLIPVQAGIVQVAGMPPRPGHSTAMLFQESRLLPWRRVSDNLAILLRALPRQTRRDRVAALLAQVGLADHADAWPEQLSGGQQQRLALARLLATEAPLLLMDEPFASLDALAREQMQAETLHLAASESGRGILFVTHSIDEALVLADDILLLSAAPGRVIGQLAPDLGPRGASRRMAPGFAVLADQLRSALRMGQPI